MPFSEIFNAGLGECLEKAVLVQLAAQRQEESFLVNGAIENDEEVGADFHAYNIIVRGGKLFLVDAQNPLLIDSEGRIYPYVAPVIEIIRESREIRISSEWKFGRTYFI
jgi:hypothetical protein